MKPSKPSKPKFAIKPLPDKVPKLPGFYWFRKDPASKWTIKELDIMSHTLYHWMFQAPQSISKLLEDFPECEFSPRIEEPKL